MPIRVPAHAPVAFGCAAFVKGGMRHMSSEEGWSGRKLIGRSWDSLGHGDCRFFAEKASRTVLKPRLA